MKDNENIGIWHLLMCVGMTVTKAQRNLEDDRKELNLTRKITTTKEHG